MTRNKKMLIEKQYVLEHESISGKYLIRDTNSGRNVYSISYEKGDLFLEGIAQKEICAYLMGLKHGIKLVESEWLEKED
jgi:hypothetical protein